MFLGFTLVDVVVISPAAFVLGAFIGYIIRARYNGSDNEKR